MRAGSSRIQKSSKVTSTTYRVPAINFHIEKISRKNMKGKNDSSCECVAISKYNSPFLILLHKKHHEYFCSGAVFI